jgi:hypothetical protein
MLGRQSLKVLVVESRISEMLCMKYEGLRSEDIQGKKRLVISRLGTGKLLTFFYSICR